MNGLTQPSTATAAEMSLEQCDDLLVAGMCNIRDAILGYTQLGLTQDEINRRVTSLGFKASVRTIKRHVADLRQEGLLPAVEPGRSRVTEWRKRQASVSEGQLGPMKQNTTTSTVTSPFKDDCNPHLTNDVCISNWSTKSDDASVPSASSVLVPVTEVTVVEHGTCIQVAPTYEQRCGTEDYNEILRLTEQLCTIFERNAFTNRMSPDQWDSIRGGFRGLVETAEVQSRYTASNLEG